MDTLFNNKHLRFCALALASLSLAHCTQEVPGSIRLAQQQQTFEAQIQVNTSIDLLWIVDNSSSMDIEQERLRNGFAAFAAKYMQPTWDIRAAVITTDTYLANPAFSTYLSGTVNGTVGWASPYINSRLSTFRNPSWNPSLVNLATGIFDNGVKLFEMVPAWNSQYSKLLPGLHDGPIAALCFEGEPYFLNGAPNCKIRDNQTAYNGPSHCLNPGPGETSETQCLNTVENDTIHSGKAVISTLPPQGVPADAAWSQQLLQDFMINVTTGSSGHGSERGLGSILQVMSDNEDTSTAFFRPNSTRGIIIVSDEDDQTMPIPSPGSAPAGYGAWSNYACDQASLVALNPSANISGSGGYCCSGGSCRYGALGTTCPSKTVDNFTYAISICPVSGSLIPIPQIKQKIDNFFLTLDGPNATNPNYFVASIVPLTGTSLQAIQAQRKLDDGAAGVYINVAADRADRYIELGNEVGNGSLSLDISEPDYSGILDSIGQAIIQQKSTFTLSRAPRSEEDVIVWIQHANGSLTQIPSTEFVVNGTALTITDYSVVLSFSSTDQIVINYQPKTAV